MDYVAGRSDGGEGGGQQTRDEETYRRPNWRYPAAEPYHEARGLRSFDSQGRLRMYGARLGADIVAIGSVVMVVRAGRCFRGERIAADGFKASN